MSGTASAALCGSATKKQWGGLALVPVALVYGRLASRMPEAASEIAYTGAVFPPARRSRPGCRPIPRCSMCRAAW